jgi:nitrite reductase (NADH) small subunit
MTNRPKVTSVQDVPPGACKTFEVNEKKIVIYNVDGKFYATTNTCVHQGGPLGDGLFDGATVTCPWHAWQFDVCTGEAIFDVGQKIDCYAVHVDGDDVSVEV